MIEGFLNRILDLILGKPEIPDSWRFRSAYPVADLDPRYCGVHCYVYSPGHHCGECHISLKEVMSR